MRWRTLLGSAGLCAAATLGAGIFSLPYVFYRAGWIIGVFYLGFLSVFVIASHLIYRRVLDRVGGGRRLLGLVKEVGGRSAFGAGFIAIVGGLILALVAYLVLGTQFLTLLFPGAGKAFLLIAFWFVSSVPLAFSLRRLVGAEVVGAFVMAAIILFVFASADSAGFSRAPGLNLAEGFLPFGAVLFALAGWTAVEPMQEYERRATGAARPLFPLVLGTFSVAILYALFVAGIFGSAPAVTGDTVSGLTSWTAGKLGLLGVLGLFAIWTSYVPIALEIKNSLAGDIGFSSSLSMAVTAAFPLLLVLGGMDNFLSVVGLAGGVFLSVQYLFILFVGKRLLPLRVGERWFVNFLMAVFLLGAVYEGYYFALQ